MITVVPESRVPNSNRKIMSIVGKAINDVDFKVTLASAPEDEVGSSLGGQSLHFSQGGRECGLFGGRELVGWGFLLGNARWETFLMSAARP